MCDIFDLSGILAPPQSLKVYYQDCWNTFNRIQGINSNVSTIRYAGNKSETYYIYVSLLEQNKYTVGRMLHIQRYPNSNWAAVSKD
jgi:hypothetical protein